MSFFEEKKEDIKEDFINESDEDNNDSSSSNSGNTLRLIELTAKVDKLSMEATANSEIRKLNNERFAQISEQIGELRTMIMQQERSRQDVEMKAEKAFTLVHSVQPEKLMAVVNKVDFKTDALKAKLEATEMLNNKLKDDIRDMRNKFALFRNSEMIKEMNDDSKIRLNAIKKIEIEVLKHSDKVDTIFNEIEKNFEETKSTTKSVESLSQAVKKIIVENESLKVLIKTKSTKNDLSKFEDLIKSKNKKIVEIVMKELDENNRRILKDVEVETKKKELSLIHQMIKEDFSVHISDIKEMKKKYEKIDLIETSTKNKLDKIVDALKIISMKNTKPDNNGRK